VHKRRSLRATRRSLRNKADADLLADRHRYALQHRNRVPAVFGVLHAGDGGLGRIDPFRERGLGEAMPFSQGKHLLRDQRCVRVGDYALVPAGGVPETRRRTSSIIKNRHA